MSSNLLPDRTVFNPDCTNYCLILDRSVSGEAQRDEFLAGSPPEIAERFNSPVLDVWREGDFGYLLLWGTFGYGGGMTVFARSVAEIIRAAIPAVLERNGKLGGTLTWMIAIEDHEAQRLAAHIQSMNPKGLREIEWVNSRT